MVEARGVTGGVCFAILALLLGAPPPLAAQQGTLTGRVLDADTREPVAGVRVTVVELDRRQITDESGRYRFARLPAGERRVRFESLGYAALTRQVRIEPGVSAELDVELRPSAVRLRDIVVSPRRRLEIAQEVPITETVFDAQEIEDANIERPKEVLQLTPGATLVRGVNSGCCSFITVRGIGQQRNSETPIAVRVDGVQQFSPLQFDVPLYDLERIEVIKGPEGAIYGRNSVAGAMLIETKDPTEEFEGYLRTGGGKGDEFTLTGAFGGPIVEDRLLFRVAGYTRQRNGYFDNITLDEKADDLDVVDLRGKLHWNAGPKTRVRLKGMVNQTNTQSLGLWTFQPAQLGPDGKTLAGFDFTDIDSNEVRRFSVSNNKGDNDRDIEQFAMTVERDLGFGTLEGIGSYNNVVELRFGDQFPYTAALSPETIIGVVDGTQTAFRDTDGWTSEVRVRSPDDQRVRWQAGGFFLLWDSFRSNTVALDQGQGILRLRRRPFFDSSTNPTTSWLASERDNEAWSVFGNLEVDLTPELTVSSAIRFDRELRERITAEENTAGDPGAVTTKTFEQAQPKFRVSYRPTLSGDALSFLNLYGSWGRGFRSGGFNQSGVAQSAAEAGVAGVQDITDQEETSTGEVGFKSRWLGDRVSWETSFYHTDDEGQPFFVFVGQVGAQILINIPEAEIKGFESTLRAQLTRGLELYATGAITDTEIQAFPADPAAVGKHIPLVPKHTFNVGASYRRTLFGDFGLALRTDFERLGEMAWTATNNSPRDPINQLGLKGGIEFGDWSARFEADNVTDEVFNSEFVQGGFAWPGQPDRWRVSLERRIGPGGSS